MTPNEAYEYASTWGSYMNGGDPGACMYGFDHNCRPQSESHRKNVLSYMKTCRETVVNDPKNYDENELELLDAFVEFIANRPIEGDDSEVNREKFFMNGNLCKITYGEVLDAIEKTDSDPFTMRIVNKKEWAIIAKAVNVGIDSYLEGITDSKFENGDCEVSPKDLCVFLRRLSEGNIYENDSEWEVGHSLMDSILTVLGFNDSGEYVGREALGLE